MTDNERDTKFLGFANLAWQRLNTEYFDEDGYRSAEDTHKILAQCAYDLVYHALTQEFKQGRPFVTTHFIQQELERIPDLKQWPPTEQER